MPSPVETPRYALPLLAAGQAQKELTHNEALILIDAILHAVVVAANAVTPPASPQAGQCWAIGAAPTGLWSGQAGRIAIATVGGWRFCAVPEGFVVRSGAPGAQWRRAGSGWTPPASISAPSGGTVSDSEARTAIASIINALSAHGIIG